MATAGSGLPGVWLWPPRPPHDAARDAKALPDNSCEAELEGRAFASQAVW